MDERAERRRDVLVGVFLAVMVMLSVLLSARSGTGSPGPVPTGSADGGTRATGTAAGERRTFSPEDIRRMSMDAYWELLTPEEFAELCLAAQREGPERAADRIRAAVDDPNEREIWERSRIVRSVVEHCVL